MNPETQHPAQRVGVFVDISNMYYAARYAYDMRVNFQQVLKDSVRNRILVRAIAYVIRAKETHETEFFDALKKIGFEVKQKDLQIFPSGATKGDWDLGIAMDMIALAPKLDTLILVSGDGDYEPLLEHLKRAMGCRVEVVAFGKSASRKIIEAADDFLDLDTEHANYLIPRPARHGPPQPTGHGGPPTKQQPRKQPTPQRPKHAPQQRHGQR